MKIDRDLYQSGESLFNPIDSVEDILTANNWVFSRNGDEELVVEVSGRYNTYRLCFLWQEDMNAMQIFCHFDAPVSPANKDRISDALMSINRNLWMGHFDVAPDTMVPCFRHTSLLRGLSPESGLEQIEDLVTLSLAQCERVQPLFQILTHDNAASPHALTLALMDTAGRS